MIKVCDTCRRRLVQFSLLGLGMPSVNLSKIVLFITMYSCTILSLPVKSGISEYSDWSQEKSKSLSLPLTGKKKQYSPFSPVSDMMWGKLQNPGSKLCANDLSKIIFPLKYRHDDMLADPGLDNNVQHFVDLPKVNQPYENYKVLVATAPPGLELGEDSDKALTIYIIFNDENNYPSPMNLPTVYFVRKRPMTYNMKDTNPILVIDSNRTVTGLRSKEIQKFVKFSNKLTNRI